MAYLFDIWYCICFGIENCMNRLFFYSIWIFCLNKYGYSWWENRLIWRKVGMWKTFFHSFSNIAFPSVFDRLALENFIEYTYIDLPNYHIFFVWIFPVTYLSENNKLQSFINTWIYFFKLSSKVKYFRIKIYTTK